MLFSAPFLPGLRTRLAALGRHTVQNLRRLDFSPLAEQLRRILPPELLAAEDAGPNSRERIYPLRLTFECFVWQKLTPRTAGREVVRAVQAYFTAEGRGAVAGRTGAYTTARQRLPKERLEKALRSTADQRVQDQGRLNGRPVVVVDCATPTCPIPQKTNRATPNLPARSPAAAFRS